MSMLQAQCDELRAMAESVGLAMPQAATLMMEAADTIWGLVGERERLFRANVEKNNEMLRLVRENAKLRELLASAYKDMDAWQMLIANSDQWGYGKGCLEQLCKLRDAMRELGITEVD